MSYGGVTYQEVAVCEVINFGFDVILLAAICIRRGEKREHDGGTVNLATSSPAKIAGVQRQLGTRIQVRHRFVQVAGPMLCTLAQVFANFS